MDRHCSLLFWREKRPYPAGIQLNRCSRISSFFAEKNSSGYHCNSPDKKNAGKCRHFFKL